MSQQDVINALIHALLCCAHMSHLYIHCEYHATISIDFCAQKPIFPWLYVPAQTTAAHCHWKDDLLLYSAFTFLLYDYLVCTILNCHSIVSVESPCILWMKMKDQATIECDWAKFLGGASHKNVVGTEENFTLPRKPAGASNGGVGKKFFGGFPKWCKQNSWGCGGPSFPDAEGYIPILHYFRGSLYLVSVKLMMVMCI